MDEYRRHLGDEFTHSTDTTHFGDDFGGFDLGGLLGSVATQAVGQAAGAAGIDPSIVAAGAAMMPHPQALQGYVAGLNAAGTSANPHADPTVVAAKATLPQSAHAGFDAAVSLVKGHAITGKPPAGVPATEAAAVLMAHGTPDDGRGWWHHFLRFLHIEH